MTAFSARVCERLRALGALPSHRVLVGLSGGRDSSALLLALASEKYFSRGIIAAHLDHGVREGSGQESGQVEALCRSLGIELLKGSLDGEQVHRITREKGSLEAALRELRYDFLRSCAASRKADWILTGHTRDDQVETILFRVLRRMDPLSFSGIPEKRPPFLRPLLGVSRRQTLSFCLEQGVAPLEDPTNLDVRFARNRIRERILPSLRESFHPEVEKMVLRMGDAARKMGSGMEGVLSAGSGWGIRLQEGLNPEDLRLLPPAFGRAVLAGFLRQEAGKWPSGAVLEEAFRRILGSAHGPMDLPGGHVLDLGPKRVYIRNRGPEPGNGIPSESVVLPVPGTLRFECPSMALVAQKVVASDVFPCPGDTAMIREEGLRMPLMVRRRRPGDRFAPLGLGGGKKLKDFLIDRKIPRPERDRIPLVLDGEGEILWVAGVEISQKAALRGRPGENAVRIRIERPGKSGC
ncbi:MAG: tRNA lysidine(34) synthetase TilS [Proteobacteria bacterium]|nr:tRNA lysidine(34) synthetase TilS [Pseudomonadota bacterium]